MTEHLDFSPPVGLRTRGTVLVVPGRGETPGTYRRFAARIAADAYRVRVVDAPALDAADPVASVGRFAGRLTAALDDVDDVRPLVLVGADTGAVALAALTAEAASPAAWWPDALVLAGLPGSGARADGSWEDELDARTHCPTHRGVLTDDGAVRRGSLAEAVPDALLDLALGTTSELPVLLLAGESDPVTDQPALARAAARLPRARLTLVRGAHHDVLNDLQHRSVAAEVVTFLEALRNEPVLTPILEVAASAW